MNVKSYDILPEQAGEDDEAKRLREAINRHGGQFLATLDAAIKMRTAPNEAQRARHMARGHLLDAALKAMHAYSVAVSPHKP